MTDVLPAHIPGRFIDRQAPVVVTVSALDYADPYATQVGIVRSFTRHIRNGGSATDWVHVAPRADGYSTQYAFDGAEIIRTSIYRKGSLDYGTLIAAVHGPNAYPAFCRFPRAEEGADLAIGEVAPGGASKSRAPKGSAHDPSYYRGILAKALGRKTVEWRNAGFPLPDDLSTLVGKASLKSLDKVRDVIARAEIPHNPASVTTNPGHLIGPGKQHTGRYQGHSHNN